MRLSKKLLLLVLRDSLYFLAALCVFFLPESYGFIPIVVVLLIIPSLAKAIRDADEELTESEKGLYLTLYAVYVCILVGLAIHWAMEHRHPLAWGIASFAVLGLFVIYWRTAASLYEKHGARWARDFKLVWLAIPIVLLIAAFECVMRFSSPRSAAFSSPLVNLAPLFILGLLFAILLRKRNLQPAVRWFGVIVLMLGVLLVLIAALLKS